MKYSYVLQIILSKGIILEAGGKRQDAGGKRQEAGGKGFATRPHSIIQFPHVKTTSFLLVFIERDFFAMAHQHILISPQ